MSVTQSCRRCARNDGRFLYVANALATLNLSYLYPFEGLDNVILAFGAWLFLRENVTSELWLGMILICFGTMLLSAT